MPNLFTKLLSAPGFNPFSVQHTPRKHGKLTVLGTRGHSKLRWEKKELPGAGAGQYAWETYGLPPYAVYGFGNINVTNPLRETFPASYVFQAVGIVGNPPLSMIQGQFITQPLMDPDTAANIGIVTPGSVNAGP